MEKERPDPDRILEKYRESGRGKMTLFLGPAAGVGKTYAMLERARELRTQGMDVIIGWVDTHGRKDTNLLLDGLPIFPPRKNTARGHLFEEVDLDGLLARKPALVLMDELAHTNAPFSRHVKRHQDVEELLENGIDVFTTMNVQHIESLNDVVERITGVRIREIVPDSILDLATEIRLVDLPAEDLLSRLAEGKVYVPEQANRALHNFFRPGNLNALRELAFGIVSERVGGQLERYMHLHGIEGPWPVRENLLVCVGPSPYSTNLIRMAKRIASARDCPWSVVTVDVPGKTLPQHAARQVEENLTLARRLGAETVVLQGDNPAEEIASYSRTKNVTSIIVGKSLVPRLFGFFQKPFVDNLIERCEGISVQVVSSAQTLRERAGFRSSARMHVQAHDLLLASGSILIFTAGLVPFRKYVDLADLNLLYLLPVLGISAVFGMETSIISGIVSFLCINYFFIPPLYTFAISETKHVITLFVFLAVAQVLGGTASRLKHQIESTRSREARTSSLYRLSQAAAKTGDLQEFLGIIAEEVAEILDLKTGILLPGTKGYPEPRAFAIPPGKSTSVEEFILDEKERATAAWVQAHGRTAGHHTQTLSDVECFFLPLAVARKVVGVMVLASGSDEPVRRLSSEELRHVEALADIAALAISLHRANNEDVLVTKNVTDVR